MKIKKLIISGLFGRFNHVIPFNEENITIVTAPNGYGKTVALKVIDAIFNKRLSFLSKLQFSSIELVTSSGVLEISKEEPIEESHDLYMRIAEQEGATYVYNHEKTISGLKSMSMRGLDIHLPFLTRIGPREWEDDRTGEIVDFEGILENYSHYMPEDMKSDSLPEWYDHFSEALTAYFIQDQRLILRRLPHPRSRRRQLTDTIEIYADELASIIRAAGLDSSKISQQLDTTFPVRLLQKDEQFETLPIDSLKEELKILQARREDLAKYNLLSSEQHLPRLDFLDEIRADDAKVLTLYVQDTKQKLQAYDELLAKISLFSSILNTKRLSFKKIQVNPDKGFCFETDEGRPLGLTQLSSGEQHQVVLLFELIFRTGENVLVLIDEPEISLHVAWQKEFLSDLRKIIEIQKMPVVIATHSPQIIDSNWHLTVDLEEGGRA